VNYSNNSTRAAGTGWDSIQEQIAKLEKRHAFHIAQYGEVRLIVWHVGAAGHV
jgi:glutamine synthetase